MAKENPAGYRPDIDGLRAVAILAVVAYHAGFPGFTGGFVGVDVFFVISGFLITSHLLDELSERGRVSFRDFYARRMRRLLPALLTVVAGTLGLYLLFTPGLGDARRMAGSARMSLAGLANFYFKRNTGGYFDGSAEEMPLLHFWSLAVEEQFYLLWPLLLTHGTGPWAGARWARLSREARAGALLGAVAALSLLAAQWTLARGNAAAAFFFMPYRAWELGAGGLLAVALRLGWGPRGTWARAAAGYAGALGFLLVSVPIFLYEKNAPLFPGLAALPPVLGTVAFLWAGAAPARGPVAKLLAAGPLVRIGLLSYGFYLWHWPLLALARTFNLGEEPPFLVRLTLVALALGAAELSLRFVEKPVRSGNLWRARGPVRTIQIGLGASAALALLTLLVPPAERAILKLYLGAPLVDAALETPSLEGTCFGQEDFGDEKCWRGPKNAPALAVWGDSHACSYFSLLEGYARTRPLAITRYCQGQTPPLVWAPPAVRGTETSGRELPSPASAVLWDVARHAKNGQPFSLVLAARWPLYVAERAVDGATLILGKSGWPEEERERRLGEKLRAALEALPRAGAHRVLLLLPYPEFRWPTLRCQLRRPDECRIPRAELDALRASSVRMIEAAAAGLPYVRVVDPVPLLCDEGTCPQVRGELPVTIDTNHPSPAAARYLGERFRADLDWLFE